MIRKITKRQFDAFCYSRQPLVRIIAKEVAWYEALNRKLLVTVLYDYTDGDYGIIVLGRDASKVYRWIDSGPQFYDTQQKAEAAISNVIKQYENDGNEFYRQGDEKSSPNEILIPCVKENELHAYFKILINEPRFEAARNLIKEIAYTFVDVDGNYIKEFQTHGFDARLWELYLYVYLHNAGFEIRRDYSAPDYHVCFFGEEAFIEAVTVQATQTPQMLVPEQPKDQDEVLRLTNDYLPIKFGSALFSKLQKKYWEKDHVKGKPLVLAIHDFHMPGSMSWSRAGLSEYLYGIRSRIGINSEGQEIAIHEKINEHCWNGKSIPSNFFSQPETEHISAVLFSNAATITKFNRMGKLAGLGSQNIRMIRVGDMFNPDASALRPLPFRLDVDSPEYEESWSDSLIMYHNPRAKIPVNTKCFNDISHMFYDIKNEKFYGYYQPYDVMNSMTIVISPTGKEGVD